MFRRSNRWRIQVEEWSSVSCRFECACHELVADDEAAIQLYRIAEEALTNAVKHGGSRRGMWWP